MKTSTTRLGALDTLCCLAVSIPVISAPYYRVVTIVLLKDGNLEAVQSESRDVFALARAKDAGICGIFENRVDAEAYIQALRNEQRRNRWVADQGIRTRSQGAT